MKQQHFSVRREGTTQRHEGRTEASWEGALSYPKHSRIFLALAHPQPWKVAGIQGEGAR